MAKRERKGGLLIGHKGKHTSVRKFDGKGYTFYPTRLYNKREANQTAKSLRNQGYNVRIVPSYGKYKIYIRKKGR